MQISQGLRRYSKILADIGKPGQTCPESQAVAHSPAQHAVYLGHGQADLLRTPFITSSKVSGCRVGCHGGIFDVGHLSLYTAELGTEWILRAYSLKEQINN